MKNRKPLLIGVATAAAGVLAGGVIGLTSGADAASSPSPSPSSTSGSSNTGRPDGDRDGGGHAGEKTVTGSVATKLEAAAKKAVPGGTVDRAETDSGDAAYEVHMTKSDGSKVTVKFDKSYQEIAVEDGMGK